MIKAWYRGYGIGDIDKATVGLQRNKGEDSPRVNLATMSLQSRTFLDFGLCTFPALPILILEICLQLTIARQDGIKKSALNECTIKQSHKMKFKGAICMTSLEGDLKSVVVGHSYTRQHQIGCLARE
jgi:hypothetical protein